MPLVPNPRPEDQQNSAAAPQYILANFEPSDRIAVLVRNAKRGETTQRISSAMRISATPFQDWMHRKNEAEDCDIYIGMNALKATAFTRTKQDILAIRHLYVDLDRDGPAVLRTIENSALVPRPNYILNTSPDKYQAIWKVDGIDLAHAEALLRALAREFDGDRAATDAARVLRVPGFLNKKYDEDFLVRVQSQTERVYQSGDFNVRIDSIDSDHWQHRYSRQKNANSEPRQISQSERDWAYVKSSLANGADPDELIAQLACSRASDKSDPEYYARLTVTKALADLREHPPISRENEDQRGSEH
jgi:RepB DNA-primase from phage plasmid